MGHPGKQHIVLLVIRKLSQFQTSKHPHILNSFFHMYRAEYWKGIIQGRRQWAILLGSFRCHGLNAFIMVTQLSVSPSRVLQTVPPHTDPGQPCHYNSSHISFYVWRCTGILYPPHIAVAVSLEQSVSGGGDGKQEWEKDKKEGNCRH